MSLTGQGVHVLSPVSVQLFPLCHGQWNPFWVTFASVRRGWGGRGYHGQRSEALIRSARRWLATIASASLMAAGLSAAATTAAQAAVPQQAGPFWPGDLLSMTNADFENGVGDWNSISNVSTLTTGTDAFLHGHSLKIVAAGAGTSVIQLTGTSGIEIPVDPGGQGDTYRVGAYVKMAAESGHTTEFDLGCYDADGDWLGWYLGTPVTDNSEGTWQWVEDDIALPADCTHVQGSPRAQFTGMHAGGVINMDEAWFAPERAALMVGAYAPNGSAWQTDNADIGPLQSDKMFFGGNSPALPGQWNDPSNPCYEITQGANAPAEPPACVINLNPPPDSSGDPVYSEAQIQAFFTGMPAGQTVIMVYFGEAEDSPSGTFSGCPDAGTSDAANYVSCFEQEAGNIRAAAASLGLTENVFIADDSASDQYATGGTGVGCAWIVPPGYVDVYLLDHYERGWADGSNLSVQSGHGDPGYNGQGAQQWNNWLGCVQGSGKPIGLAEYGLCSGGADCNRGSTTCGDAGSTTDDTNTMAADNSYLAGEPSGTSPTLLWEYWYANCWQFDNSNGGITEWQSIENENGGAVGG
jgi:hypothetical protein